MLKNLKIISISLLLFVLFTQNCFSGELNNQASFKYPVHNPVPGGIAIIELKTKDKNKPDVFYKNKKIMVRKNAGHWQAIVGLSLNTKSGQHKIKIKTKDKKLKYQIFATKNKEYKKQYITLKNKGMVTLSPENLKRAISDKKISKKAFATWLEKNNIKLDFIMPVDGIVSSRFGLKRFFNKKPRKPHSGIDIAAPTGTLIKSPADGRVIATGNFYFNGNVVFVDHGQGLITMFCHMNKINVSKNQIVKKADKIGEVGETGRVTGAHLHFSVSLNNTRIDPELLLPPIPELKDK
ncbi:Peptidase, M23/M37 family [hydrothermal vent metagenome]|uniref:Peptidase, M23/M37 family n=1 Tax=hydrothermal vent metagenome TaxID=652676 RepID=A0A3B1AG61_9ZZZZ